MLLFYGLHTATIYLLLLDLPVTDLRWLRTSQCFGFSAFPVVSKPLSMNPDCWVQLFGYCLDGYGSLRIFLFNLEEHSGGFGRIWIIYEQFWAVLDGCRLVSMDPGWVFGWLDFAIAFQHGSGRYLCDSISIIMDPESTQSALGDSVLWQLRLRVWRTGPV